MVRFHSKHVRSLILYNGVDSALMIGLAGGRVPWGEDGFLYSFRVFLLFFKIEVAWTTGE